MIIGNNYTFPHLPLTPRYLRNLAPSISNKFKIARFLALAGVCFAWAIPVWAQSGNGYLQAGGPQRAEMLSHHIEYYEDSSWEKTITDMAGIEADKFSPLQTPSPDFGFTDNKVWLRINVENTTENVEKWYLYVQENFLQYYDVYIQRENKNIYHIESHNPLTPFSDRTIVFPQLVTEFGFSPKEKITIFIAYWSGGSSNISLSLETKESFTVKSINQTSKNFISYGMMLILIVTSGLALLILRLPVILSYLIYVIVILLFLMHSDGVTFQYLWPKSPFFNSFFSIIIGLAMAIIPYSFARVFLRTKIYHPRLDKLMVTLMIATPVIVIISAFIDPQFTKKILIFLVFLSIFLGTIAGFLASLTRFREVRFYLFAWVFGAVSAGLMNMRHLLGFNIGQDIELDSIRVSVVVDAFMMGLAVADRYSQNIKVRRQADEQSLLHAQLNLKLNKRLFDLEEQYRLATELSASRDKDLQNTVHDIRQPLHALRLNLQTHEEEGTFNQSDANNIDETFIYLETLIADQLQNSITQMPQPYDKTSVVDAKEQDLNLPNVLASIYEMFRPDAQAKGLDFRYVETSQHVDLNTLSLMRIMTNLVSNAIKYTPSGRILLGVKRSGEKLRIEVHDTGVGLSEAEFLKAQERAIRLRNSPDDVEGHGYGLAIAKNLANKHSLNLYILPDRKSGTTVVLEIPHIFDQA
jgi:signal transduction histidine kinase